jgi:hypothetical protein
METVTHVTLDAAVLNVRDALNRIATGQTLTVDGTAGVVLLEDCVRDGDTPRSVHKR